MEYQFECPRCGEEIIAEVNVGEHMVDWSEQCENPACLYHFNPVEVMGIYEKALESTWGAMIDRAHDLLSDR